MALKRLRAQHLRLLSSVELELDPGWNFVFGPNGAGKTTLLEAVHIVGRARSFRTRQNRALIAHGHRSFIIHAEVTSAAARGRMHRVGIECGGGSLELRLDGASARAAELASVLPVHVLEPGAHTFIDGGPTERRRYLDWGVFHVEHRYLEDWRQYRRVLGQRNAALKAHARGAALDVWTEQLALVGQRVDTARSRYLTALATEVGAVSRRLLGAPVELRYRAGFNPGQSLREALEASRPRDQESGITQVGPHRADLSIRLGGTAVRDAASRGQQKLVVAALVLGQVAVFAEQSADPGIVLVDDPAAELDADALTRVMTELAGLSAQRVVTGLAESALAPLPAGRVFHVEQGSIKRVYNKSV